MENSDHKFFIGMLVFIICGLVIAFSIEVITYAPYYQIDNADKSLIINEFRKLPREAQNRLIDDINRLISEGIVDFNKTGNKEIDDILGKINRYARKLSKSTDGSYLVTHEEAGKSFSRMAQGISNKEYNKEMAKVEIYHQKAAEEAGKKISRENYFDRLSLSFYEIMHEISPPATSVTNR